MWEERLGFFEFGNDLDEEFLFSDEFLDDGVVDFIFFEFEVLGLELLELMLEFNQFVLLEFVFDLQFHFIVLDLVVLLDHGFYLNLEFPVFVLHSSLVEPFRVVRDHGHLQQSLLKDAILDLEFLSLVGVKFEGFELVLESAEFCLHEFGTFLLKLALRDLLFEFGNELLVVLDDVLGTAFLHADLLFPVLGLYLQILLQEGLLPSEVSALLLCYQEFLLVVLNYFQQAFNLLAIPREAAGAVQGLL